LYPSALPDALSALSALYTGAASAEGLPG